MTRTYSPDFWRMVLEDLRKLVNAEVSWLRAIAKVAESWDIEQREILRYLQKNKLGAKLKHGRLTNADILRVTAVAYNSEQAFDAYVAKRPLQKRKSKKDESLLTEGERGYGAWHYSATAGTYHGVSGSPGAMDGFGPNLANDGRLLENHLKNLQAGRPLASIVTDLLETGKNKKKSNYEKTLDTYANNSKLHIYRRSIK